MATDYKPATPAPKLPQPGDTLPQIAPNEYGYYEPTGYNVQVVDGKSVVVAISYMLKPHQQPQPGE